MPATTLRRVAPVFVTTDLARALAHYERLGFTVEAYDNADYYGYVCRDGIEFHLAKVNQIDHGATTSCAYLWVDDALALYEEWAGAGVEGRLQPPNPTAYGLTEGAHVDPDGNLIRFGSPPVPPRALRQDDSLVTELVEVAVLQGEQAVDDQGEVEFLAGPKAASRFGADPEP